MDTNATTITVITESISMLYKYLVKLFPYKREN